MSKYGVILADPPWHYRNGGNGYANSHYPLMTVDDIAALPIGDMAADNSVLLLWSTWPQVFGAVEVIKAWGFEHVTGFPWIRLYRDPMIDLFGELHAKPVYGTGAWVRGCSEYVLISRRGDVKPPSNPHFMGLISKRFEHSRKPDNVYQYAEQFDGPYLELFARRPRANWDTWGNELTPDVDLGDIADNVPPRPNEPQDRDPGSSSWLQDSLFD